MAGVPGLRSADESNVTVGYASVMVPVGLLVVLGALASEAWSEPMRSSGTGSPRAFTIEVFGLSSEDAMDRRLAQIVASRLAEAGHVVVAAEERDALREAEADLTWLATRDPAQAMDRLRTRTADWRIEWGVQGTVGDADSVYGMDTYSARFEVSIALVRTIDGRLGRVPPGVGVARREDPDSAMEQALIEAASRGVDSTLERLRLAEFQVRSAEELVFAWSRESLAAIERLRSHLPEGHRMDMIEGGVRIEPPLEESWHEEIGPTIGWTTVDRSPGVRLIRLDTPGTTLGRWLVVACAAPLFVFLIRRAIARRRV